MLDAKIAVLDVDRRPDVVNILSRLSKKGQILDFPDMTKKSLLERINGIDILLIRLFEIDQEILNNGTRLKAVIKSGVGVDHIDVDAATKNGIHVVISPGNHISVAESAILLMLALSRNLIYLNKNTAPDLKIIGNELYGKTLGIVGFGRIGRHVCSIASGLKMRMLVYDPFVAEEELQEAACGMDVRKVELDELLGESDFISLHCPLKNSTRHLIGEKEIGKMKRNAFLINTARGAIIDESALFPALKEKRIAGAGLDVFEKEPLDERNPLLGLENVIATPHRLIQTRESIVRQAESMARSAEEILEGVVPEYSINKDHIAPHLDRVKG